MPCISRFYGITIAMFFAEHGPPHFHARYAGYEAKFSIADGELMAGKLPPRAVKLVRMWARRYKLELMRSWTTGRETGRLHRVPPLE